MKLLTILIALLFISCIRTTQKGEFRIIHINSNKRGVYTITVQAIDNAELYFKFKTTKRYIVNDTLKIYKKIR